jgi:S1-C subfamily serine protease
MQMNLRNGLLILLIGLSNAANAQQQRVVKFSTGTGFFVNEQGYLLTNFHVVQPCKQFTVYGENATTQAQAIAVDTQHDLALLKAAFPVAEVGIFSEEAEGLSDDDPLTVIGYPGKAWKKREPVVRQASFIRYGGPNKEKHLLQFSDSVALGNSGGPLLDSAGNVAGVIVAKSTMYKLDLVTRTAEEVGKSDVAINLNTVWGFLNAAKTTFTKSDASQPLSQDQIVSKAKRFIVNVRCVVE